MGKKDSTPKNFKAGQGSFRKKLEGFFKSKLGKSSVQGEEILGVEITTKEIRLAQISSNKANLWVLEKLFIHPVNLPDDASVIDNSEKIGIDDFIDEEFFKYSSPFILSEIKGPHKKLDIYICF